MEQAYAILLFSALLAKWVIVGRFKEGTIQKHTLKHFGMQYVLIVVGYATFAVALPLKGTFAINWWYRALGARIGRDVWLFNTGAFI